MQPSKLTESTSWINCLLRFTRLPKDLCNLVVEYLDDRPKRLVCTEGDLRPTDIDYLRSKGVTILPDSRGIDRLSTATIESHGSDGSQGSHDSRRVLLKWLNLSTKVVVCDTKWGECKVEAGVVIRQLGSNLLGRVWNDSFDYSKLDDATNWMTASKFESRWTSIYPSCAVCTEAECQLAHSTLRTLCQQERPFYNNHLYELRGNGSNTKLCRLLTVDRNLKITCHGKTIDDVDSGIAYYTFDRHNRIVYCLNQRRLLKFDLSGNSGTTDGDCTTFNTLDTFDATFLADWNRSPIQVFGFEVCSLDPRSDVELVVLANSGFDRYNTETNRWTYDDRHFGTCSMVTM